MITENIVLETNLKKQLKHLAIDKNIYVSTMLINGARYFLDNNKKVAQTFFDEYEPFTMKIDENLKKEIKDFCIQKDVRIKDFWNEVAYIVVESEGVIDV